LSMVFFGPLYVGLVNSSTPGRLRIANHSRAPASPSASCSPPSQACTTSSS
jgi:hypothetical protein